MHEVNGIIIVTNPILINLYGIWIMVLMTGWLGLIFGPGVLAFLDQSTILAEPDHKPEPRPADRTEAS